MSCAAVKEEFTNKLYKEFKNRISITQLLTLCALSRVYIKDFMVKWLILISTNLNPGHCSLNVVQSNCPFLGFNGHKLIWLCTTNITLYNYVTCTAQGLNNFTYLEEYLKRKVQTSSLFISLFSRIL